MKFEIEFHDVKTEGLPNMEKTHKNVVFLHDGSIYSGWPVDCLCKKSWSEVKWEASEDCVTGHFFGVRYWAYMVDGMFTLACKRGDE